MITRTYPIVCPSCCGLGYICDPMPLTTTWQIPCPACGGSKVVTATETDYQITYATYGDAEPVKT